MHKSHDRHDCIQEMVVVFESVQCSRKTVVALVDAALTLDVKTLGVSTTSFL